MGTEDACWREIYLWSKLINWLIHILKIVTQQDEPFFDIDDWLSMLKLDTIFLIL